ncbi:MAG TPA: cytidine deaminase [Anaerolineaceae bacterium]|nr:cytidine deaminase [Anaerolineaceae bacterium]
MLNDETRQSLIQAARQARRWAYVPYSHYPVGAAVLTESGRIYDGVNVENAAYPAGICAERVAIFKAISEGERRFTAVAVVTSNGGSPCGSCRQVMAEFGIQTTVIIADEEGKIVQETSVAELLPGAFLPADLGQAPPGA